LPEFPFGYRAENRLTGDEIRALVLGHEVRGQDVNTAEPYRRMTTEDGKAEVTIGSSFVSSGVSKVEGDFLCTLFDIDIEVTCAALFRNPKGTPEQTNEYVVVIPNRHIFFSVVE
jgi:hypothetical protein